MEREPQRLGLASVDDATGRKRDAMLSQTGQQFLKRRILSFDSRGAAMLKPAQYVEIDTDHLRESFLVQPSQGPRGDQVSAGYFHANLTRLRRGIGWFEVGRLGFSSGALVIRSPSFSD